MSRPFAPALTLLCVILCVSTSAAKELRIAAWNIEHLRDEVFKGPNSRTEADYQRLAQYVAQMDADVVALQEVEGADAASRVFPLDQYAFYFTRRTDPMLTGFAVRKDLKVTQNPDFEALNISADDRFGTDITVEVERQPIRMLSVHLRAGCWQEDIHSLKEPCVILKSQMQELERWIDQRARECVPFVVMGDFNRRYEVPNDALWTEFDDGDPPNAILSRVTEGLNSDCCIGHYPTQYIDHIVLDKLTTGWILPGSFRQIVFREGAELKEALSDHCSLSVVIDVGQPILAPTHFCPLS